MQFSIFTSNFLNATGGITADVALWLDIILRYSKILSILFSILTVPVCSLDSMCDGLKALKGALFRSTLLTRPQTWVCGFFVPWNVADSSWYIVCAKTTSFGGNLHLQAAVGLWSCAWSLWRHPLDPIKERILLNLHALTPRTLI